MNGADPELVHMDLLCFTRLSGQQRVEVMPGDSLHEPQGPYPEAPHINLYIRLKVDLLINSYCIAQHSSFREERRPNDASRRLVGGKAPRLVQLQKVTGCANVSPRTPDEPGVTAIAWPILFAGTYSRLVIGFMFIS